MWLLAVVSYLLYTHAVLIYPFARKKTGIFPRNSKLICNFKKMPKIAKKYCHCRFSQKDSVTERAVPENRMFVLNVMCVVGV